MFGKMLGKKNSSKKAGVVVFCLFVAEFQNHQVGIGGHNNRETQAETQRFSGNPTKSKGARHSIFSGPKKEMDDFSDVGGEKLWNKNPPNLTLILPQKSEKKSFPSQ